MVTKSRPSLDGSVRPPGGFSNTNSQVTPKEAFLSTRRSFGWKNPNLWPLGRHLGRKKPWTFCWICFFCLLSTCKWMNIYEYLWINPIQMKMSTQTPACFMFDLKNQLVYKVISRFDLKNSSYPTPGDHSACSMAMLEISSQRLDGIGCVRPNDVTSLRWCESLKTILQK